MFLWSYGTTTEGTRGVMERLFESTESPIYHHNYGFIRFFENRLCQASSQMLSSDLAEIRTCGPGRNSIRI